MRRTSIGLFLIFSLLLIYIILNMAPKAHTVEAVYESRNENEPPFAKGERIEYEVRYKGVKVGESILTFHGEEDLEGKKVYHITFFTRLTAVTDNEELYGDTQTFFPVEVHRTIKRFGTFTTRIQETYDQKKFRVDIRKKSKLRKENFFIEKDSPLHNTILLSYFYRTKEKFDENKKYKINLPTLDFEIMYKGKESIETPLGEYEAYVFTSSPPRFKLWLGTDERKIPLKIENPTSKLDYSLVIKYLYVYGK